MRAEWMRGKFGTMSHWLHTPVGSGPGPIQGDPAALVAEWNERVNAFDTDRLADQLSRTGASWFILTIGQNSGFYCSPNPVYDKLTKAEISRCTKRDLFADLARSLKAKNIKTLAYLPSGAPDKDLDACLALDWQDGNYRDEDGRPITMPDGTRARRANHRLESFQKKWEQVITCWAERWGDLCAGWWIDGVYFADQMYRFEAEPNFKSLARALRAGNHEAAICFNNGIARVDRLLPNDEEEDYSSGELNSYLYTPFGRLRTWEDIKDGRVGESQLHLLNFLGGNWGQGEQPRLPDELSAAWTQYILANKGAVTWDIPTSATGQIPEALIKTMSTF